MPYKNKKHKQENDRQYRIKNIQKIKAYRKEYYWRNRVESIAKAQKYYYDNRDTKLEYHREWYKQNKKLVKDSYNLKVYKLTSEKYNQILKQQKNRCAVCNIKFSKLSSKLIHIDHNHKTDKVRGLLCHKCNLALGLLCEDIKIIESLLRYME